MTYELLFVNGNKGLTANLNGRFIFPDRKSNIKEAGLYNCTITVNKDKYAFVTGTPIQTSKPGDSDIQNLICQEILDTWRDRFHRQSKHYIKQIGDATIVFSKTNQNVTMFYFSNKGMCVHLLSYDLDNSHDRNVARLYCIDNFDDTFENNTEIKNRCLKNAVCNLAEPITDDMLMKVSIAALSRCAGHYSYRKPTDIRLYDDKILIIETEYYGIKNKYAYIFNGQIMGLHHDADTFVNENTSCKIIDINEVIKFAIENHLGTKLLDDQETYEESIIFMGNTITVTCLNSKIYLDEISDESKEKANESFKKLESFRKRIGKQLSKASFNDFSKLAPRNILDLKWD